MSSRTDITDATKRILGRMRRGSYFVKRGALLWHADSWQGKARGAGVMLSDFTILREVNEATITVHLMGRIEDTNGRREIDDSLMDEIGQDAEDLLVQLQQEKAPNGRDDLLLSLNQREAVFAEAIDPDALVQGLIVSFEVTYQ